MAHDVFGGGVDDDVDAVAQRLLEQGRRPGIVEHHQRAGGVGRGGDGRDVLDLEGQRPRRFQVDDAGVGPDELGDAGADQRVVVGGGDAEAAEQTVAQGAHRGVYAVAHQDVIAAGEERHQRDIDRGQAGGQRDRFLAAFERRDRLLEGKGGRRAVAPVVDMAVAVLERGFERRNAGKKHGRGVIDRRVDDAVIVRGTVARMAEQGQVVGRSFGHRGTGWNEEFQRLAPRSAARPRLLVALSPAVLNKRAGCAGPSSLAVDRTGATHIESRRHCLADTV